MSSCPQRASTLAAWRPLSGRTPSTGRATSRSTRRTRASTCSPSTATSRSATSPITSPSTSTSPSSTWTGRAAATPTSRRSPPPTASSTAAASGSRATSAPTRAARSRRTRRMCPDARREVESVGADFGRVRVIKLEPQDYDAAFRRSTATTTTASTPTTDGWVVRVVARAHRLPRELHGPHGAGPRRPPRPDHRGPPPAAPRLALRARHAAAVARRRATPATRRATR